MKKAYEGKSEIIVRAKPEQVWAIVADSRHLPKFAPMVKHTTGTAERVGSTRKCLVEWEGRSDQVVERCIEAIPNKRIVWAMEEGMMLKMFSKIQFWFELEPAETDATVLSLGFSYEPRHLLARVMYSLMMARKLAQLRQTLLGNLRKLAEENRV